jgi:hypothetical protein
VAAGWRSLGALFLTGGLLAVAAIPLAATGGYRAVAVLVIGLLAVDIGITLCWRCADLPMRALFADVGVREPVDHPCGDRQRPT